MKKIRLFSLILVIILLVSIFAACNTVDEEGNAIDKLVVYNWEDYIDESEEI